MSNSYDLEGKSALVTGGASGIGRAIVDLLVFCVDRVGKLCPHEVSLTARLARHLGTK